MVSLKSWWCSKTFAWGSSKASRRILRLDGFCVRHDERDLGAHVVFTRQLRNRTTLHRFQALGEFWEKLKRARGTLQQKVRAVRTAAWPRAMHGVGAVIVGRKHWVRLRSCYMAAMKFAKPGANPMVQLMLDGFGTDPQLFAIWTSFLDFRAIGSAEPHLASLDIVGVQGAGQAQASISEVLSQRIHQLGWTLHPGGFVSDGFGRFNLLESSIGELKLRVGWAWQNIVAAAVVDRLDFPGFERAHLRATQQGLQQFPIVDQTALRAVLNGTTFTNRHAYHWSDDGNILCPACGQIDSLHHKYWECPFIVDLLQEVPPSIVDLVPSLPSWACDRGWTVTPAMLHAWRTYLINLPIHVDFAPSCGPHGSVLDLFTDGSCMWGAEPDFRLAAWSVCCGALVCRRWNGLVNHEGSEPEWISFAQLYVDWQITMHHAGVTKITGKWTIFDQDGATPEQVSLRKRCKHFRLMIQQFAKDAKIDMATCTGRPCSDLLQCHIGCASIAICNDRRLAVDRWLKSRLTKPVFGLGESLDAIPPGW